MHEKIFIWRSTDVFIADLEHVQEINLLLLLGEGNLNFCCMDSRKIYFRSVSGQNNNNNLHFKGRHI